MGGVILFISIVLQLFAAAYALRLVFLTRQRLGWALIGTSISLMAIRRIITFVNAVGNNATINQTAESVALIISLLMLIGLTRFAPIFTDIAQSEMVRRLNEDLSQQLAQREAVEAMLTESEERFRLAVRGTSDGLWEWIPGSDKVWYADRFVELLEYEPDEFPGTLTTFNDHLHPDDHENTWAAVDEHLEKGTTFDVEFRLRTKSGAYRWFRSRGIAIRDEEGSPTRMAGAIQDIHQHKEYDQKLEQQADELQRSNEELKHFAYIASHDLEEPLRAVTGFTTLLRDDHADSLNEEANELIDHAISGAQRMQRMIRDLLEYSRVGRSSMNVERISLDDVLSTAMENLELLIRDSQAKVVTSKLPEMDGNEVQLVRLFQNLISNSIKFRGGETPHVTISCVNIDDDAFEIRVSDNGIGIPEASREHVFRVFARLNPRSSFEGTGLGLAVCRRIVEGHGGKIWIADSSSAGTTVSIRLPAHGGAS